MLYVVLSKAIQPHYQCLSVIKEVVSLNIASIPPVATHTLSVNMGSIRVTILLPFEELRKSLLAYQLSIACMGNLFLTWAKFVFYEKPQAMNRRHIVK